MTSRTFSNSLLLIFLISTLSIILFLKYELITNLSLPDLAKLDQNDITEQSKGSIQSKEIKSEPKTTTDQEQQTAVKQENANGFTNNAGTNIHKTPPCGQKTFGQNFPPTAIHSFMGAGNTWLRHLIETATGFYTGSAFSDKSLFKGGFKGEFKKPSTAFNQVIGIKVHNPGDAKGEVETYQLITDKGFNKTKCVILIRNPFDTFLSEFNRMLTGGHTKTSKFDGEKFKEKFKNSKEVLSWIGLSGKTRRWVFSYRKAYQMCTDNRGISTNSTNQLSKSGHSAHIVFYEDLKNNTIEELKKIAKYLEQYDEDRFKKCVIDDPEFSEGKFHRKKHLEVDPFTDVMREQTKSCVKQLNESIGGILPDSYLGMSL